MATKVPGERIKWDKRVENCFKSINLKYTEGPTPVLKYINEVFPALQLITVTDWFMIFKHFTQILKRRKG